MFPQRKHGLLSTAGLNWAAGWQGYLGDKVASWKRLWWTCSGRVRQPAVTTALRGLGFPEGTWAAQSIGLWLGWMSTERKGSFAKGSSHGHSKKAGGGKGNNRCSVISDRFPSWKYTGDIPGYFQKYSAGMRSRETRGSEKHRLFLPCTEQPWDLLELVCTASLLPRFWLPSLNGGSVPEDRYLTETHRNDADQHVNSPL